MWTRASRRRACFSDSRLKPPRKGKKGGGIALFTDETNRTYIETLTTWLAARQKAVARHGDAIVTTLLGPEDGADNYMVYTAMGAIMDAAGAAWRIGFGDVPDAGQCDARRALRRAVHQGAKAL